MPHSTDIKDYYRRAWGLGDRVGLEKGTHWSDFLNPGEFLFIPLWPDTGFEIQADTAACIVEYGYWTKPA